MIGFKHTLCALLLTMFTGVAIAQNNTNSPYTRYGFGDLSDQGFGNSKAMGGVGFGLRDGAQINPLNPASYTAIDSLTFLFEGGVSLQNMNLNAGGVKLNAKNSSFDYLAMQFRLHPRLAMSIGLLPFSNVGYTVSDVQTATDAGTGNTTNYVRSYSGDGGLHQLYAGLGMKILQDLSVGVNVSYFWGDINRTRGISYPNMSGGYNYRQDAVMSISAYKFDFGLQYTKKIDKKHAMTFGAIYSPKQKLSNDYDVTSMLLLNGTTQVMSSSNLKPDATLKLPNTFGFGVTYNYDRRLTVGVDYSLQQWSKAGFDLNSTDQSVNEDFKETYAYSDRSKISLGAEYIPSLTGRSYLGHVKYRLGAYYMTPYYKINGEKAAREFGVTGGVGLPIPRSRSILSISGQFVRVTGQGASVLDENIFRVSVGLTFNERWFFKRRVE